MLVSIQQITEVVKQYKYGGALLLTLPLYVICPTFGLVWSFLLLLRYPKNFQLFTIFLVYLAIWISLINITKIPVSDQVNYLEYFKLNRYYNFIEIATIANSGELKEPIFHLFSTIVYYFTFGSGIAYFFSISLTIYGILFYALYKFGKLLKVPIYYVLTGCIVITFFTQFFSYSLHIIRQVLANVIVMYAVVNKCGTLKNNYWLLILAFLIHSSSIFISLLSLFNWLYYPLKKKYAIVLGCGLIVFIVFFGVIGQILMSNISLPMLGYLFSRMNDNAVDNTEGVTLSIMMMVFIPLTLICLKILIYDLPRGRYYNPLTKSSAFYPIIYIYIILTVFILSFSAAPLIQYRFFAMVYVFIPFILPYALYRKNLLSPFYLYFISLVFVIRFILAHNTGEFKYAEWIQIAFYPSYEFFNNNYAGYVW